VDEQDEEISLMTWIESQRPENTTKSYQRYSQEFLQYAQDKQLNPKSPVAVASFMRYCVTDRPRKLGRTTASVTVPASIAALYRYSQSQPQNSVLVRETKKTVIRNTPAPSGGRKPLKMKHLKSMAKKVDGDDVESVRNFFMVLVMTLAMMRESEIVALQNDDVWIEEDGKQLSMHIFVQKSKTDQEGDGHQVVIGGAEDVWLCPVQWYHKYQQLRDKDENSLFYTLDGGRRRPLSEKTPNFIVKNLVKSIGIDSSKYGSHSCRKGGCTAAIEAGTDIRLVAKHGRWKSDAINTYIVDSVDTKLSVSRSILQGADD
jgi:site-specific recombinase XerD